MAISPSSCLIGPRRVQAAGPPLRAADSRPAHTKRHTRYFLLDNNKAVNENPRSVVCWSQLPTDTFLVGF